MMINIIKNIFKKRPKLKHGLTIWDKVITKSNEPDNYNIGYIVDVYKQNMKSLKDIPIVEHIDDNEQYMAMWLYEPYSEDLEYILDQLLPMEQYIYMLKWNPWWIAVSGIDKNGYYTSKSNKMKWLRTYKRICEDLGLEYIEYKEIK